MCDGDEGEGASVPLYKVELDALVLEQAVEGVQLGAACVVEVRNSLRDYVLKTCFQWSDYTKGRVMRL